MAVLYLHLAGDQDLKLRPSSEFSIPFYNKFRGASYEKLQYQLIIWEFFFRCTEFFTWSLVQKVLKMNVKKLT